MIRVWRRAGQVCVVAAWMVAAPCLASSVAYWPFDESGGDTAHDVVGSYDGSLAGLATLGAVGVAGGALSLDRTTGDYVDMGSVLDFTAGDFSISVWLKTTTQEIESVVVGKHQSGVVGGYFLCVNTSSSYGEADKIFFYHSPSPAEDPVSTTSVNDGIWHHVVAVYRVGGVTDIFVDGTPAEDSGMSAPINPTSGVFMVGGITYGAPAGTYSGLVDDLQLYNHALTGEEIEYLFANPGVTVDGIFADDFESGDFGAWSEAVGG